LLQDKKICQQTLMSATRELLVTHLFALKKETAGS